MNRRKILGTCVVALIPLLAPLLAWGTKIDVKTGLWESSVSTDMGGAMPAMPNIPPETLAKMPPEQRAQMEAIIARHGKGMEATSRSCVTEKTLERGMRPETQQQSCKVDSVKTTGKTQEMHVSCSSAHGNSTGVFKLTAISRESIEGTMVMSLVANNRPMTMTMHMKGKWLDSNCGDVKPHD